MSLTEEQKGVLADFVEESSGIIEKLNVLIEQIEMGEKAGEAFTEFAQKIDGIMGCAKTLGLESISGLAFLVQTVGNLSEGCKALGYKASQLKESDRIQIVAGFLAEALEMIHDAIADLKKGYVSIDTSHAETIKQRLSWLISKLNLSAEEQAAILKKFGLSA